MACTSVMSFILAAVGAFNAVPLPDPVKGRCPENESIGAGTLIFNDELGCVGTVSYARGGCICDDYFFRRETDGACVHISECPACPVNQTRATVDPGLIISEAGCARQIRKNLGDCVCKFGLKRRERDGACVEHCTAGDELFDGNHFVGDTAAGVEWARLTFGK